MRGARHGGIPSLAESGPGAYNKASPAVRLRNWVRRAPQLLTPIQAAQNEGRFLEIADLAKFFNKAKADIMGPKKELQQEGPSASTSTSTTTTIATSTPSDSSDTAPNSATPSSSSSHRPRRWVAATRGSDNSSDEEGDTPVAAAPSQQPLASSNSSSSSATSSGHSVVQVEPVGDDATTEVSSGKWEPSAETVAEAFAGDSTLSRIKRAVAGHLLQAQPSYTQPWGQIVNQVAVLKQLRLQEWQAVRQALVEDPRFVEGSKDMGNMNATIGLALDRSVWPGRPEAGIPSPAELRSACQQAFEGTTEALQLMRAVSEVILDQAPVSLSMRWPDVVQELQSRGTPVDSTAYSQLSSHPAFGISFRDARATITLRPALLRPQGQDTSSHQLDPQQQSQTEVKMQLSAAGQLQPRAQQGVESSAQAQARAPQHMQQHQAEQQDLQQLQQQGQLEQKVWQTAVGRRMRARVAAAFPGDSLAAQLMREVAELVVSESPHMWRLRYGRAVELGVDIRVGLAKLPKPDRILWRQAITEHPAWQLEPSTPETSDMVWVLSKQQFFRLAASPAAAEAAVATVQAAHKELAQLASEGPTTYMPRFKALALKELENKREASYFELCDSVFAQDTELQEFFEKIRPGAHKVLLWLSEDPRIQVDPPAGTRGPLEEVRLSVRTPISTPASLSQAVSGGDPATFKEATSDSTTTPSAVHVSQATPVGSSGGGEGDSSTAAARFRAMAHTMLVPGDPLALNHIIKAGLEAGLLPRSMPRKERTVLAQKLLSEDPMFHQWRDDMGNPFVIFNGLGPAQQQQEQPVQPAMAEEMQLVVHPDGTAHLVPGSSTGSSDGSATPPHPPDDDITSFLNLLPDSVSQAVQQHLTSGTTGRSLQELSAVWLDYGRPIRLQFRQGPSVVLTGTQGSVEEALGVLQHQSSSTGPLSQESVSAMFDSSNRATRHGTLHRVTAMRGFDGSSITGLTYKVGCSQSGGAAILGDVLHRIKASIHDSHTPAQGAAQAPEGAELCLAPPRVLLVTGHIGTGKTTLLRDISRYLADECGLSVVVVDTHGDMGGASSVPHAALGSARRMEVGNPIEQHIQLSAAVLCHAPEVLVVDEVLTHKDVAVVRSSAQRGIPVVCGVSLAQLEVAELRSHHLLSPLFPRFTKGAKATSTTGGNGNNNQQVPDSSTMLAEGLAPGRVRLHPDLESSISRAAAGQQPAAQLRRYDGVNVWVKFETDNEPRDKCTTEPGTHGDSSSGSDTEQTSGSQRHDQQAEKEQRRHSLFSNDR